MDINQFINKFKALADKNRLRVFYLLAQAKHELCVCEIVDSLGESQYNVSRYLKELKYAGLVIERKEGKWVHYSIPNEGEKFQKFILEAINSIPKDLLFLDLKRLRLRLSLRKKGKCVIGFKNEPWKEIISKLKVGRRT